MIKVTDVSQKEKYINCELIEKIELVPDTLVTLINGHTFMVKETPEEIIARTMRYKQKCREVLDGTLSITVDKTSAEGESSEK